MIKQEEVQNQSRQLIQKQAEKQVIDSLTASLSSHDQFHSLLLNEFKDMKGTPAQKKKRIMNRLQKFFLKDAKINVKNGYFCKRRQPPPYKYYEQINKPIKVIDNQVIIFGIDFIKSREIIKAYLPEDFQTIDMSHIKLIFKNFDHAMESLRRNMRQNVIENETKLQISQIQPPKGWTEMRPYYFNGYERRLLARFASEQQRNIVPSGKIQSEIPEYAKRIYNLKKRQSEDIEQNYLIRQQLIREKKQQNLSRRSHKCYEDQNEENNNFKQSNRFSKKDEEKSQKSFTLRIGGRRNQNESQGSNRSRSRDKDFDDNKSVVSKRSSTSSLANRMANNLHLEDNIENESVLSDVSFILDQENNKQLFEDMAIRLGLINIQQNDVSVQLQQSFVSQRSSSSRGSISLSGNIPDQPNNIDESFQSHHNQSFTKKKFNYEQYIKQQQEIQRRRNQQEKTHIIISSDEEN